jgi:hypothetical protein
MFGSKLVGRGSAWGAFLFCTETISRVRCPNGPPKCSRGRLVNPLAEGSDTCNYEYGCLASVTIVGVSE